MGKCKKRYKFLLGTRCKAFPAVGNGGAVCSHIYETNTRRCQVRCNLGYEHLEDTNMFEICGPDTNWLWSYQIDQRDIPSCIGL